MGAAAGRSKFAASLVHNYRAMNFDSKIKELAKAHDAVDRLQDVKDAMEQRSASRAKMHDRIVRGTIFGLTAFIIGLALWRL